MKKNPMLEIIRPQQWYKNLLIFLPLIFSLQLFDGELLFHSILGFVILCMAFSGMYIINDVIDSKKDKLHPEKSKRPIPSGRINRNQAIIYATILLVISEFFSFMLEPLFFIFVSLMILLTITYSIRIKDIFLLDVFFVSLNFMLRAISGAIIIDVSISSWLVIGIFLVALLLSFGKRFNEISFLNDIATKHRKVLNYYSKKVLKYALGISGSALIIAYTIYAILGSQIINDVRLLFLLPLVIYIVIQYISLTLKGRYQGKEFNDLLLSEKSLLIAIIVFVGLIIGLLYLMPALFFTELF